MASRVKSYRTNIISPVSSDELTYLEDHVISIADGKIASITPFADHDGSWQDFRRCIALPGFIDLHTHISQYHIRGAFKPALLPWLTDHVFPAEKLSESYDYARALSAFFYEDTIRKGTSFSVIYTAPFRQAADAAFDAAREMQIKAKIGMSLMDRDSCGYLAHSTDYALSHSITLAEAHPDPKLGHIFTPRFALSCTPELLREIGKYAQSHDSFIQTHLSENKDEIQEATSTFGTETYTDIYADFGLLGAHSILAHAIHLTAREITLIQESRAMIAHCPDSNFFLKSGAFPLQEIKARGIPFGLGSDVAAGTTLFMPYHAKMMNYRQDSLALTAEEMLFRLTLKSARILALDADIGSIECGKDADISFFELPNELDPSPNCLYPFFFASELFELKQFLIDGKERL